MKFTVSNVLFRGFQLLLLFYVCQLLKDTSKPTSKSSQYFSCVSQSLTCCHLTKQNPLFRPLQHLKNIQFNRQGRWARFQIKKGIYTAGGLYCAVTTTKPIPSSWKLVWVALVFYTKKNRTVNTVIFLLLFVLLTVICLPAVCSATTFLMAIITETWLHAATNNFLNTCFFLLWALFYSINIQGTA